MTTDHLQTTGWLIPQVRKNWLWITANLAAMLLFLWLAYDNVVLRQELLNEKLIRTTGKSALVLLVLSLSCTPFATILGFTPALTVRKSLGLWAVAFACLHLYLFLARYNIFPPEWWNLWGWWQIFGGKFPYAQVGAVALALLLPLVATSNRWAMRRLGRNWKRLHRLVYLIAPLAIWHYWWRRTAWPEIEESWQPMIFAGIVGLLLIVRVTVVRKRLNGWMRGKKQVS